MYLYLTSFPTFVVARTFGRSLVKREIAELWHVFTEPLVSSSISLQSFLSSKSTLHVLLRMDDGGITSGIRVISVGLRILVIVSSSPALTLPLSLTLTKSEYDIDLFTGDFVAFTRKHTRTSSRSATFKIPSLVARNISYTNHLIYPYECHVCGYRILQDARADRPKQRKDPSDVRKMTEGPCNVVRMFTLLREERCSRIATST